MALVPGFQNDIFISYSHIDNESFGDVRGGWVDIFHEMLQNLASFRVGRRVQIWRDKRLAGGQAFSDEIHQQLSASAMLVSVLSPGYMQSQWCNRELLAFADEAQRAGTLRFGTLQRAIKILRVPVDRSTLPPFLDEVLGHQFYRTDAASGRTRDYLLDPAVDAEKLFRATVDDVAQDIAELIKRMSAAPQTGKIDVPTSFVVTQSAPQGSRKKVFLAWTSSDLTEQRDSVRRELESQQHLVVPGTAPPLLARELGQGIQADLADAAVTVHLVGAQYGLVPEGAQRSIVELQTDAVAQLRCARVFWLSPQAASEDARQQEFLQRLRQHYANDAGVDFLTERSIEELKTLLRDRLQAKPQPTAVKLSVAARNHVYLMCDQLDRDAVKPIENYLFDRQLEVRTPLFEGDAEEIREDHSENLKQCDGLLIFWGKAKESWLRNKLRDLTKYRPEQPPKAASILLSGLPDTTKEGFRTNQAQVLRLSDAFEPTLLQPFLSSLV
jgi:hypothetical protein